MQVHVSLRGSRDLTAQIYRQLRQAVLDGRLPGGTQLPPTRTLAAELSVARNTVSEAYDQLIAEGYLSARVGAGTFVSADGVRAPSRRGAPAGTMLRPRTFWASLPPPRELSTIAVPYNLQPGTPDPRLFPLASWRRVVTRELRPAALKFRGYGDPTGPVAVRESIARHVGVSRAVKATASDIVLTQGAQQAIDLVARVLIEPGTCVAVEDPCYPFVPPLLRSYGARVVGVPVDAQGLDVAKLPSAAKVVYVTPSHQCPLGMAMSLARRQALLEWADRRNALIVEDDYDTEFRFGGRPLDPLQSLDRNGRVLYVGTFSKVMLPVLRLGFTVVPASLQQAFRSAKLLGDGMGVVPLQNALARFIDEGLLVRHIRKASKEYAARYERLVALVEDTMGDWLEVLPAVAGLHLSVLIREERTASDVRVAERARGRGVLLLPISPMYVGPPARQGFVLGYGGLPVPSMPESMRRLRLCLDVETEMSSGARARKLCSQVGKRAGPATVAT